ncbi:MAG: PorV/PorQ family protein [Bacteroidota bacterium]|nr:PorV/PorQ family protein [Bacteroidota bacterium]
MKPKGLILLIALAVIQHTASGIEVKKTGTTGAKFLSIGIGPRANAMGGAFTSVANDASALYWNPAGIALVNEVQTLFTYSKLFADIKLNYFGVVVPANEIGKFGFSVTALSAGEMDVTTEDYPEGTGETFSAASYSFSLSYARRITDHFMVGVNAKYIREDIFNSSANGICFDIGTIFTTPFYGVRFSSSISNYGTKMKISGDDLLVRHDPDPQRAGNNETIDANYATDEFELPLRLQIGISRDFMFVENQRFTIAIDAAHPNDNAQYVNFGGELALMGEIIFLRGGYKTLFLKDSQEGLSLGIGLNYTGLGYLGFTMDYSYQKYDYLGDTHSFGIILRF